MSSSRIIPPGSTLGILGGGQLGRMTALAAARLGYRSIVYAPDEHSIAAEVSAGYVRGTYDDEAALAAFARQVDVITYEFENVPEAAVLACQKFKPVRPGTLPIHLAQHRLREKDFLRQLGIGTADYLPIRSEADIAAAAAVPGALPGILKTCTEGYDGKGQARVADKAALAAAWADLAGASACSKRWCRSAARSRPSWRAARRRDALLPDRPQRTPRRHPAHHRGAGRPAAGRAGDGGALRHDAGRRLDLVGLVALEMFVTADAACWPTSSRRGRITRATGPSTPAPPASSSSSCAPSAACRWARSRRWRRRAWKT
jgi:5-(carboxyamino)imidazole ribonucleotide synthase